MKSVRIGAGLGFYGDSWRPVRASIESGGVQYIASDHLAELTLAILQKDRQKDPGAGYARDCVPMLTELWPLAAERGVKFVMNAGGLNPHGAREAVARAFREKGFAGEDRGRHRRFDLRAHRRAAKRGRSPRPHGHRRRHRERARPDRCSPTPISARQPIAEALAQGADIVITGRVADAALSLGPLMHELGWRWDDWDRLAQGLTVGHLLECSGQASGGNFGSAGEWAKVQNFLHLGYPIAEVSEDGSALLTKAPGTGGKVSFDTLRQQLLYEVHDPHAYYSPDVVLDMGTLAFRRPGQRHGAHHRRGRRAAPRHAEGRRRLSRRLDGHRHDRLLVAGRLSQMRDLGEHHQGAGRRARLEARTRSTSSMSATTRCSAPMPIRRSATI